MPLTQLGLNTTLNWYQQVTNGYGSRTFEGPDSLSYNLSGVNVSTWNQLYAWTYTITASSSVTIDLTSLTNLVNESFTFMHVLVMQITSDGGSITYGPGASNGLVWGLGGTSPTFTIPANGIFTTSADPNGSGVVVDSTHKTILLYNGGGTTSTVSIAIAGSTT